MTIRQRMLICFIACPTVAFVSFAMETQGINGTHLWQIAATGPEHQILRSVLLQIRLPRLVAAAITGGLLAAGGVLCQGLFRNPLATPSILGTTSGATALVALGFFLGLTGTAWYSVPLLALLGAFLSTTFILILVSLKSRLALDHILLAGFALGALLSAVATLLVSLTIGDYQKTQSMFYWLMGGFNGTSWQHVMVLAVFFLIGTPLAYSLTPQLNVVQLGEEVAQTLGIDLAGLRRRVVVTVAIMVGGAVATGGGIGFIGLVVPHVTRLIIGHDHRLLLIVSMINGATLLMISDLIARTAIAPSELQVGVLTSLLGAPFFLMLLIQKDQQSVAPQ